MRAVGVVADRGADTGHLAGGDRGADTRAADEDPALRLASLDRLADLARLVGVVHAPLVVMRSQVDHLMVDKRVDNGVTQVDAAMVERDRDLHRSAFALAMMFSR